MPPEGDEAGPGPLRGPPPGTMTCRDFVVLVTDYFEDELSAEERARFEDHLALCEGCVDHVDHLRRTIEVAGRLSEEQLAPDVVDQLLEAFRDWSSTRPGRDG
jgi:anti-sigma factor RsiW